MRFFIFIFALLTLVSCQKEIHTKLQEGDYRVTLAVQDNKELPFNFKVKQNGTL